MRRSCAAGFAVAALGTMLTACGGSAAESGESAAAATGETRPTAAASAALDPCSVLTPAELGAITSDAVSGSSSEDAVCTYRSNPDQSVLVTVKPTGGTEEMTVVRLAANVLDGVSADYARKGGAGADAAVSLKRDTTATPDIGDEAHWGPATTLSVRKGDAFVSVMPPLMHDPANHAGYPLIPNAERRKIAEAIASKVLARIS